LCSTFWLCLDALRVQELSLFGEQADDSDEEGAGSGDERKIIALLR